MARYGFHGGKDEIKYLVLFIMNRLAVPVTLAELGEAALLDEGVDYFLFCQCVGEMVQTGHLTQTGHKRGDIYEITQAGREIVPVLQNGLAHSLQKVTCEAADGLSARLRRDACVQTEVFPRDGVAYVRLSLTDGRDPLLSLEIMAGSEDQAEGIRRYFQKNAESVYEKIMGVLVPPG